MYAELTEDGLAALRALVNRLRDEEHHDIRIAVVQSTKPTSSRRTEVSHVPLGQGRGYSLGSGEYESVAYLEASYAGAVFERVFAERLDESVYLVVVRGDGDNYPDTSGRAVLVVGPERCAKSWNEFLNALVSGIQLELSGEDPAFMETAEVQILAVTVPNRPLMFVQ